MSIELDAVQHYCKDKGYADFVVAGGLEGLIAGWERCVAQMQHGYRATSYNYRNDMDGRRIINEVWPRASEAQQPRFAACLAAADTQFLLVTIPEACIWGTRNEAYRGWCADADWWYYRLPKDEGEDW